MVVEYDSRWVRGRCHPIAFDEEVLSLVKFPSGEPLFWFGLDANPINDSGTIGRSRILLNSFQKWEVLTV